MKAPTRWFALKNRDSRRVWAFLCLLVFLLLQAFVASSALHRAVHADAAAPGHQCVVTLFAHGQVTLLTVSAGVVLAAVLIFCLPQLPAAILPSFDYRLSPSRAPPRS